MLTAGAGRPLLRKTEWRCMKGKCRLLVQEDCYSGNQNGGAGRENADCWYRKGECRLLVQEGGMLTADAGRENVDCWCRKGEC